MGVFHMTINLSLSCHRRRGVCGVGYHMSILFDSVLVSRIMLDGKQATLCQMTATYSAVDNAVKVRESSVRSAGQNFC